MNSTINKAVVAALGAVVTLAGAFGYDLGLGEETIVAIAAIVTPILVWAIPNKPV